jgi:aerobic C4-dicarboxylate transport protein
LSYIKAEILLVLGTSSSESALPLLMEKLKKAGCSEATVGLVLPLGYSFNLCGINIYMTLAAIFLAQAMNIELTIWHELAILGIAMINSKGAAGVTGAGLIVLIATLTSEGTIPVAGVALILGIDRFMSECRAITSFIANAVVAVAISKSCNEIDNDLFMDTMNGTVKKSDINTDFDDNNTENLNVTTFNNSKKDILLHESA